MLAYPGSVDGVGKVRADQTRRTIFDELVLADGQSLVEICSPLAMRHDTTSLRRAISQRLAVLEGVGLVRSLCVGRTNIHHLDTEPLRSIGERWPLKNRITVPLGSTALTRIDVARLLVDDGAWALTFYTGKLGFVAKTGIPLGSFAVDDMSASQRKLSARGVVFPREPTVIVAPVTAMLKEAGGNVIRPTSMA